MKKETTYTEKELRDAMRKVSPGSMAAYDGHDIPLPKLFSMICEMGFYNVITGKVKLDARTKAVMIKSWDDIMHNGYFKFAKEED